MRFDIYSKLGQSQKHCPDRVTSLSSADHQERLKEAEQKYKTLFKQSPDGVLIIDPVTRRAIEFNDAACRQLGYTRKQFSQIRIDDYEVQQDSDEIASHMQKAAQEEHDQFMTRHRTAKGDIRDVLVIVKTIYLRGNKAFHCIFRDMTEARRMEELSRALVKINSAVNSTLNIEEILKVAVAEATDALGAEAAEIGIHENGRWVVKYVHGSPRARIFPEVNQGKTRIVEQVAAARNPVIVADTAAESRYDCSVFSSAGVKSLLGVPLVLKDEVIGVIFFIRPAALKDIGEGLHDFCSGLATAVSLAMENARLFRNEIDTRLKLEEHARRLAVLHDIGLMLNNETAPSRLFRMILVGAARMTGAGVGVMTLVNDDKTEVIAEYYAPWYESSCQTRERDVSGLHHRIMRLVGPVRDAVRINDLGSLKSPLKYPEGHPKLKGLMIGTIRDPKGKTRGHFMLSSKANGEEFTSEDEEIISLLAAQSSVALISAENFGREKIVADALQSALLSEKPERDDLDMGFIYQSPSSEGRVGGDFYDFHTLSDGTLAVVVGDVCGKGLQAATYTAMVKYMLKAYLGEGYEPGECLTRLNREMSAELDSEIFVTTSLVRIDAVSGKITYSLAGHPPSLIRHGGQNPVAMNISASIPLGVLPDHSFVTHELQMEEGSVLAMYTDGLIEARPAGGEPFGQSRLARKLASFSGSAQETAEMLLEGAVLYSGGRLLDDIAIVVVKIL